MTIQKMIQEMVKQIVLKNLYFQNQNVKVYQMKENWHFKALSENAEYQVIESMGEFKNALNSKNNKILLVPKKAIFTWHQAQEELEISVLPKTIFWES